MSRLPSIKLDDHDRDKKQKLLERLFEKGQPSITSATDRPRVFSLQKGENPLTAKVVKQHRELAQEKKFQDKTGDKYPRSQQLIMDSSDPLNLKQHPRMPSESEMREKMSRQRKREKLNEPQPVVNLIHKLSGIKRPQEGERWPEEKPSPTDGRVMSSGTQREQARPPAEGSIDEFIEMCRENKLSPLEFTYMVKQESNDYYNMKMMNYSKITSSGIKNYFTLSAKGVTKYENSLPVEFLPLKEWMKEKKEFNEIKELSFFRKFRKWKSMKKWLKILSQKRFKEVSEVLGEKLFILQSDYRAILLQHNSICYDVEHFSLVEAGPESLGPVEFREEQAKKRNVTISKLKACSKEMHNKCREGLENIVERMKGDIISEVNAEEPEKKTNDEKSKAFEQLGFPDNISYGQRSKMRTEFIKFLRLAYLLDFIVVQALGNLYISNVSDFFDVFEVKNELAHEGQLVGHTSNNEGANVFKQEEEPLFTVEMSLKPLENPWVTMQTYVYYDLKTNFENFDLENFCYFNDAEELKKKTKHKDTRDVSAQLTYEEERPLKNRFIENSGENMLHIAPNRNELVTMIQEVFVESQDCIQVVERWSKNESFLPYVNALEEWDEIIGERWDKPDSLYLSPSHWISENDLQKVLIKKIKAGIDESFQRLEQFKREHGHIMNVFWKQQNSDTSVLNREDLAEQAIVFNTVLSSMAKMTDILKNELIIKADLGIYQVDCEKLSAEMIAEHSNKLQEVCRLFLSIMKERAAKLKSWYQSSIKSLTSMIIRIEEFVEQKHSLDCILLELPQIKEQLEAVKTLLTEIEANSPTMLKKEDREAVNEVSALHLNLFVSINDAEAQTTKNMERFRKTLKQRLEKLTKEIDDAQNVVSQDKFKSASTDVETACKQLGELETKITDFLEQSEKHHHYEEILEITDFANFDNLEKLREDHKIKYNIFRGLKEMRELSEAWNNLMFKEVKVKDLSSVCEKYAKHIMGAERAIPESTITPVLKKIVWLYKDAMPVIVALRSEYLREQHWKEVKDLLKSDFSIEDNNFTLNEFLQLPVQSYQEEIIEISVRANQEFSLNKQLDDLENEWAEIDLKMKNYKESTDVFVLYEVDEILARLDEGLATVSNLLANRYIKPLRPRAEKIYAELFQLQEIIDNWLECQKKWIYLENIFAAPDIKKQLPQESADFQVADKFLKNLMKRTYANPKISKLMKVANLFDNLVKTSETLDHIEKQLEDYLEVKRRLFPRFYFLSNDELLEILAKSQNLEAVEQHLNKCFEGLVKLMIEPDRPTSIEGMKSPEGETVKFFSSINARASVEGWLLNLQKQMIDTLKRAMREGIKNTAASSSRKEWIMKHKGQVVAVVSQILWTMNTEQAIKQQSGKPDSLMQEYNQNLKQLQMLTEMVRGDLSQLYRKILVALITTDVHNRDIVLTLSNNEVESIHDNYWQQQLRYYSPEDSDTIIVKQVTATMDYGYEYLGATSRLVITPLTDRCWITITSALANNLGASPAGPAGTGKTESTKDLAKGLGRLCIVFNCSDQITAAMMNKLFSGLIQQGAWTCLDEFNRIEIEVLSVIAQQLLVIRIALKKRVDEIEFEGKLMPLKKSMGVFITMNPGYAGRTELPDNLKSLFRPVSMMIPDYAMIAEIMLFAEGFQQAPDLSKKMVQLYKLSSEQLSQQDHYDFGMRAVKSLLVMAGALKRADVKESEEVVLIRAMKDSNIPKFLKDDIPLFEALVQDLFPNVKISEVANQTLNDKIESVLTKNLFQSRPPFVKKVVELFDILNVRFGVMLVGHTGTGKTTCFKILREVMTELRQEENPDRRYQKVAFNVLNPKSVTMGELYGEVDQMTQEWVDGIASSIIRACNTPDLDNPNYDFDQKYWIVFDGPVDALWIENMNTVLDDNMTLCLANSERIKLRNQLRMLFEVQDLAVASPATVSRCGMVYLSEDNLTWEDYMHYWFRKNCTEADPPEGSKLLKLAQEYQDYYKYLFATSFEKVIAEKATMFEPFPTVSIQVAQNICTILSSFLPHMRFTNSSDENTKKMNLTFAYSLIWAAGGSIESAHYTDFEAAVRVALPNIFFPKVETIFDFLVNTDTFTTLISCESKVPEFEYSKEISYFDLVVPTVDTTKFSFLLEKMLEIQKPVFFTGQSGVGKSIFIGNKLMQLKELGVNAINLNCSAQTKAKDVQLAIEAKLHKKGKTLFGARPGESIAIFIDDINMPSLEFYGAQPTIELLRQLLNERGFYDRFKLYWKDVVDTTMIACGANPGGGRNNVTKRFLRHFLILCIPQPSDNNLKKIFESILKGYLNSYPFVEAVKKSSESLVAATLAFYKSICNELLPTPSRFHYTFNMRDISKVFQGILQFKPQSSNTLEAIWKLWYHELWRVFGDRLIDEGDRNWFRKNASLLADRVGGNLPQNAVNSEIVFSDMLKLDSSMVLYEEITELKKVAKMLENAQDDYNSANHDKLSLVFFDMAIYQILKISRILRQPRGNAMLIGVGGSGKQSLSKLAAFIVGCQIFQVEMVKNYNGESFRADLQKLAKLSGCEQKQVAFVFTDLQISYQSFLQDINNLINSGEVPNLFKKEDIDEIYSLVRPIAAKLKKPDSPEMLWNIFINNIRQNLHVILCMSPVGEALRQRCRKFPSIINCSTLIWFSSWPKEALYEVAKRHLDTLSLSSEPLKEKLAEMCMEVNITVIDTCETFLKEKKREVYVTPKSYLDQLYLYGILLKRKMDQMTLLRNKLSEGLSKLHSTNEVVSKLKDEMKKLQPVLEEQSIKTEKFLVELDIDRAKANKVQTTVEEETDIANMQAEEIKIIEDEAKVELDKALPALRDAAEALNKLNKNDITEIKGFANPPAAVQMVMEAVCVLLGEKTQWAAVKQLMMDMSFLDRLRNYDKTKISDTIIKRLRTYTSRPQFEPNLVGQKNLASKSLCMWCIAMDNFHKVSREVEPKKRKLAELSAKMEIKSKQLKIKMNELKAVRDKVAKLQKECDQTVAYKKKLEEDMDITEKRLERAEKLSLLLADEGTRWKEQIEEISNGLVDIPGDSFLSSSIMSYLGPFTGVYRESLINKWQFKMKSLEILYSKNYTLANDIETPIRIRDWVMEGLPNDPVSIDNAILAKQSQKWPLMIDPQGEANRWIKKNCKQLNLKVINFEETYYLKTLEAAIQSGYPVLIEDVKETIETAIDSILQKQIVVVDNMPMIRLGDKRINYHQDFKLFLTSKVSNPHYLPETFIKVNVINFSITFEGLQDQLLSEVMVHERPQIEKQRDEVIVSIASGKKKLKEAQDLILEMLAVSKGMILDDVKLIETLEQSKIGSIEIIKSLEATALIEEKINESRSVYVPVAIRGTVLYFVVADLNGIDPMYQYSLGYFKKLFRNALHETEANDIIDLRIHNLNEKLTKIVFTDVSNGLFQSHKKIFSFLICSAIRMQSKLISPASWNFLIRGAGLPQKDYKQLVPNPDTSFYSNDVWFFLNNLAMKLPELSQLMNLIRENPESLKELVQMENIFISKDLSPYLKGVSNFTRLVLLKALAPEKLMNAISQYVSVELGGYYEQAPAATLENIFNSSDHKTPMIIILSQGADPTAQILRLAQDKEKQLGIISLGQGQGKKAAILIEKSKKDGSWVLLQNCHLAKSWMNDLEKIVAQLQEEKPAEHHQFRLFLTSMPASYFPISILQNSIKLTIEPPRGLKSNLRKAFQQMDESLIESCPLKKREWLSLLFSLTFFHAVIQERRKFGALGFNIRYEFNESDLQIATSTLRMFLNDEKEEIPWESMLYMTGHINYGGRVTDDWDRVCLLAILKNYYSPECLNPKHLLSEGDHYYIPNANTLQDFRVYIDTLPNQEDPAVFGLHPNANIIFMSQESNNIIKTILSLQPVTSASSETTPDEQVLGVISSLAILPPTINTKVLKDHLLPQEESTLLPSLSTFVLQEVDKFNNLFSVVRKSLEKLEMAIKGLVAMSEDLEQMYNSLLNNEVPAIWKKVAYSSLKPLSSWYIDLNKRAEFISDWINKGWPNCYWMSGLFFPQGFLTAVLQTHARRYKIPIDTLSFKFKVIDTDKEKLVPPKDGVYIHGLYLDGAQWDSQHDTLIDQDTGVLECLMPVIHFLPVENYEQPENTYRCPCYKTSNRVGVLSTTGQSTNFILPVDLNTKHEKPQFWILRGAALICQLDN